MKRVYDASIYLTQAPEDLDRLDAYFGVSFAAHGHIAAALRRGRDNLEDNRTPVAARAALLLLYAADEIRRSARGNNPKRPSQIRVYIDQALASLCAAVADEIHQHLERWVSELTKPWTYTYLYVHAPNLRRAQQTLANAAFVFNRRAIPPKDPAFFDMLCSLLPTALREFNAIGGGGGLEKRLKQKRKVERIALFISLILGASFVTFSAYVVWRP